jgi:hypothetical protein
VSRFLGLNRHERGSIQYCHFDDRKEGALDEIRLGQSADSADTVAKTSGTSVERLAHGCGRRTHHSWAYPGLCPAGIAER